MNKLILLFSYINILRFWPHLLIYLLSKNRKIINEDLDAYKEQYKFTESNLKTFIYLIYSHKAFRSLFYYRIGNISKVISWLGSGVSNFHLAKRTKVEGGIILFHSFGSLLDCESIGKGTRITHNVSATLKNGKGAIVGRNVELNPCCMLVGGIRIGDNCVIGAGAVVFKDVPDNCIVVGNPAYILKQDGIVVKKPL